jgi:tetratricopeptide (TPR) repeat protein
MQSIEEILNQSANYISVKKFGVAIGMLLRAQAMEPENAEVLKNLGLCYVNMEQFDNAVKVFEKLVTINAEDATSWYYLANCQEKTGEDELAIASYSKVVKFREDFFDAYKGLAMLFLKQGSHEDVISLMDEAIKRNAQDYQFFYLLATAYMSLNKHGEAIENLNKALELHPNHQQILNNLGSCYLAMRNFDEAEKHFLQAYEIDPKNPAINYNLGSLYQLKNEYKRARQYFEETYNSEPNPMTLSTLAYCALQAGEYAQAIVLYKNLSAMQPGKPLYQKNLMDALVRVGKVQEALAIAKKLHELNPRSVELCKQLAKLYRLTQMPRQASDILFELIKRGKIDPEVYFEHALCAMKMQDWESAKNSYRKVIQLQPENAIAHRDLSLLYLNMNLVEWAQDEMQTALELQPENPEILVGYAAFLHETQEFALADEYYKKAIAKAPDEAEFHLCWGINLLTQNKTEEAILNFKKTLSLEPENPAAKYHLAKTYYSVEEFSGARALLEDIIPPDDTSDIEASNLLAVCYMALELWQEAEDIFSAILEKHPKNHIVLTHSAKCFLKLGEPKKAKDLARRALEVFSDFEDALLILEEADGNG